MAHPRAARRPPHRAGARCRAVRSRRDRQAGARADLRRRRDGRPLGDLAARGTRRSRVAPCVRGLRALVGAGEALPDRAGRDPRAAPRPPGPEGRQRVHPVLAGRLRSTCCGACVSSAVQSDRVDRFRVLADQRREPCHGAADRAAGGLRVSVAAPAARAGSGSPRRPDADAAARLALRHLQPGGDAAPLPAAARQRRCGRLDGPTPRRRAGTRRPAFRCARSPCHHAAAAPRIDRDRIDRFARCRVGRIARTRLATGGQAARSVRRDADPGDADRVADECDGQARW